MIKKLTIETIAGHYVCFSDGSIIHDVTVEYLSYSQYVALRYHIENFNDDVVFDFDINDVKYLAQ